MKSSVRILAIALALAFLLLARTAYQDDTTASAEDIDLSNGEATFADLLDGEQEAEYIGLSSGSISTVYFYIESDALGTQVTARTTSAQGTLVPNEPSTSDVEFTLQGGNVEAAAVDSINSDGVDGGTPVGSDTTVTVEALDRAYCTEQDAIVVSYTNDRTQPNTATTSISVFGWGVSTTTVGAANDPNTCNFGDARVGDAAEDVVDSALNVLTGDERTEFAQEALDVINNAEIAEAMKRNHLLYEYKSGTKYVGATTTTPARRYTAAFNSPDGNARGDVGGATKPLDAVTFKYVDTPSGGEASAAVQVPTFITGPTTNEFRLAFGPEASGGGVDRVSTAELTFDIVDVYEKEDLTLSTDDYNKFTSGFGRAYVSSGSAVGTWVTIREVEDEAVDMYGRATEADASATSNLFQGMVVITNDTDEIEGDVIYVQDGDTLSLQVFSSNGSRSSNVIASATAIIDDSPPEISDLSPADESVINDDTLRVSFNVNDEGAGLDFRSISDVVTMVQAQARDADGDPTGELCPLAEGDDIGNAGGNASRVGILVSPPSDPKFSGKCRGIIDPSNPDQDESNKFNLIITARDLAGNVTAHTTQLTIDTEEPDVDGNPSAGKAWNDDDNEPGSSQNSILVKFNESLDVDTVSAADFTVGGYTIDSVEVVGENEDNGQHLNEYVVLALTEDLTKNARPSVTVTAVSDVAGNSVDTTTRTSDNKIKATINVVSFSALIAEKGEQAISFTSDEALRSQSGDNKTEGSVGDDKVTVKVADDTMGGTATFKESKYGGSRAYGVLLQAVDVDGNVSKAGEVKVSDEAYELTDDVTDGAKFDVKLDNWPLADTGFDKEVKGEVKAYIGKTMVASSTGKVGWEDGAVELQASAGRSFDKGDKINLSYSYVNADQVIQVDVDEPTMTSIPADNAETDYAAGAIQFNWSDDDGYAGDTYKTVTLNEATHEGPDGESMDILDQLTTNDEKKWVLRPAEDLALGAHEFTLKATDAAGNDNTVSVTITVIERKPVEVGLSPGWNLISFRGEPASLDANDIFSSDTVSVVSQYDGRRVSPWTVWTRGSDGSLSSSPAGRTTIDPGLGLYVLSTDGSSLMVDIPGTSKDNPAEVPPSIALIPGWNLIAVIIIDRDEKKVDVDDYLPAGVWSRAFKRDNTTGALESISPLPEEETEGGGSVDAGQALWVYAAKAGVVVPK